MTTRTIARHGWRHPGAVRGTADWLCLAATPTFATMALLTSLPGGSAPDMLCMTAPGAAPLNGMACMYLLMSAFHAAPWLKLLATRRNAAAGAHHVSQHPTTE